MRSSGNTRNLTGDTEILLFLWVAREDHPRACTGRRLIRRRLVRSLSARGRFDPNLLLLDPTVSRPLTPMDAGRAHSAGVLGIDCSWNRLHQRGGYPEIEGRLERLTNRRRLPWLIATNPQHFGRVGELTTAEAFGATLFILGDSDHGRRLLDGFAGGTAFFSINRSRLDSYARAQTVEELIQAEEQAI